VRLALRVETPGPFTTVQDLGRYGFQSRGVPVSGTMDPFALRLLNRLVGNPDGAAALEATVAGPTLVVEAGPGAGRESGILVALGGAECDARAEGVPVPPYRATFVPAGARLVVGPARRGARPLLAVAGGIDVPVVLGSRSTSLWGGFGGLEGRPLAAGDRLPVGPVPDAAATAARDGLSLLEADRPALAPEATLRVVLGPQDDRFAAEALATFATEAYTLTTESNRMGARLAGPRLAHLRGADIVSDGTTAGSVQVPESGLPIVLLADRQTTGGYTKIATVVSADLPKLAQLLPGGVVRFRPVDLAAAHASARAEAEALDAALGRAVRRASPGPWAASGRLLAANLVSGVVRAGDDESQAGP
jgi:biotin-dependent carboxylase-like uncharacterized protein